MPAAAKSQNIVDPIERLNWLNAAAEARHQQYLDIAEELKQARKAWHEAIAQLQEYIGEMSRSASRVLHVDGVEPPAFLFELDSKPPETARIAAAPPPVKPKRARKK